MNSTGRTILILLALASIAPLTAPEPDRSSSVEEQCTSQECNGEGQAGEAPLPDSRDPDENSQPSKGTPVARQWIPDSHSGWTRATLGARLLLRLPGLTPMPGLHNHGMLPWIEWQMDLARLASASMTIVAPGITPHAPPHAIIPSTLAA